MNYSPDEKYPKDPGWSFRDAKEEISAWWGWVGWWRGGENQLNDSLKVSFKCKNL